MKQQLDIFDDSRDVMLRNDVLHALAQRDGPAAAAAHRALRAEFPGDDRLPAMQVLIDTLGAGEPRRFARHDEAQAAVAMVQDTVRPAARTVWPAEADARAWLSPVWAALARSAAALPFDAGRPELHAAALWLQAGRARSVPPYGRHSAFVEGGIPMPQVPCGRQGVASSCRIRLASTIRSSASS
jgi:hypothetical protein